MPDGAEQVRLAAAGQTKGQRVMALAGDPPRQELGKLALDPWAEPTPVEGGQGLFPWQIGLAQEAVEPTPTPLLDLGLGEVVEILPEGPPLADGGLCPILVLSLPRNRCPASTATTDLRPVRRCPGVTRRQPGRLDHCSTPDKVPKYGEGGGMLGTTTTG